MTPPGTKGFLEVKRSSRPGVVVQVGKYFRWELSFHSLHTTIFSILFIARWIRFEETKQKPFLYRKLTPRQCERREERLGSTKGTHANSGKHEGAAFPSVIPWSFWGCLCISESGPGGSTAQPCAACLFNTAHHSPREGLEGVWLRGGGIFGRPRKRQEAFWFVFLLLLLFFPPSNLFLH